MMSNQKQELLKINIGCGTDFLKDYINIDIDAKYKPDVIADFRNLTYFNVDEIYASHLLEHFDRWEAIEILKQWCKWLKKGGMLVLDVPDFEKICEEFVKGNKYWLARHAFGSHKADWAFHKDAWWEDKFKKILPAVGFHIIRIKKDKRVYPMVTAALDKTISTDFQLPKKEKVMKLPNLIIYAQKL